jgi:polyisoprenoid-binding protein YceI
MKSSKKAVLAAALASVTCLATVALCRAAEVYQADRVHSAVIFRVKHMNTSYSWGRFNDISGVFALDPKDAAQSKLEFQVKSASIDTGDTKRDTHLKGPDFFNSVQYPTISFRSKSVASSASGFDVTGDLTLHGVTKPVTLKVNQTGAGKGPGGGTIAGIDTSFTIKRSDFGMSNMIGAVGDEVWVNVSVEGALQR